jgi:ATPase subunit of ABC transporter with duplicated ATPase domains
MSGLPPHGHTSVAVEMQHVGPQALPSDLTTQKLPSKDTVELVFREIGYRVQVAAPSTKKCACLPPYDSELQVKAILKGVTGIIRPQKLTCILGASGAGKTSLLNILSGSLVSGTLSGQLVCRLHFSALAFF